jgi:hypothetical protein
LELDRCCMCFEKVEREGNPNWFIMGLGHHTQMLFCSITCLHDYAMAAAMKQEKFDDSIININNSNRGGDKHGENKLQAL